jgi:hypothetical protein
MVGLARCRRGGGYEPEAAFRVASFAPAQLALGAAFGRLPSQPPLVCVQVSGPISFPSAHTPPQLKSNSKILHQWCLIIDTPEC